MNTNSNFLRRLFFVILFILALFLIRPTPTADIKKEQMLKTLTPSLFVNESALFHPLLRQGTFKPLDDVDLETLTAYLSVNADSGEVYTAKNATERISPASLTKLMTAMVALDVATPSARLMASGRAATQEPTVLGVKPGEIFTLEELIKATIATSANDAATIIGEEILRGYGGNEEIFVALMNKKAEALGLGDSHFVNTQGFDNQDQYSNAYDLARVAHYAYENYPLIRQAAATAYSTIEETEDHGFYHLPNWNGLLGTYPGVDGLKIGYTQNAKYCTIVTASHDNTSIIVIVLGAESIIDRDLKAARLLNFAFSKEKFPGVHVSEALIKPRIDEWRELREQILEELESEK
jgi:D-alanyl-D-alanine carboxypeptidase (penicillin-binding protein 5/6)